MHMYDNSVAAFIQDTKKARFTDTLQNNFFDRFGTGVSESEVKSWGISLKALANALEGNGLDETWIILEYQLPLSSARVDCILLGQASNKHQNIVLIELKQWETCEKIDVPDLVKSGGIEHLHPSAQVRNYRDYLIDSHQAFNENTIFASSCAYLHNAKGEGFKKFQDPDFLELISDSPIFGIDDTQLLIQFLRERIGYGLPEGLVNSILDGDFKPSKKLLDHVADIIELHQPWKLLNTQQMVFNRIVGDIENTKKNSGKSVIIIRGGPGTGKSVIALQVLAAAARKGYNITHATASKAFTTNLRGAAGRRGSPLFTYSMNICGDYTQKKKELFDLIVVDEAHRLRKDSVMRFRKYSSREQAHDLIDSAKVSVFLLDQQQNVRSDETGTVEAIRDYAENGSIPYHHYDLTTQFRCAGSESYVNWIDYVFGLRSEPSDHWKKTGEYEVVVFDNISEMEKALHDKAQVGNTARMVAGFCWPWSDPTKEKTLVNDVKINDWQRPWNRKPGEMFGGSAEAPQRHPYTIWATQAEGLQQIGCIYSAQGFEFDYVGVIIGEDLIWSPEKNSWVPNLSKNQDGGFKQGISKDPELQLQRLKHIYRVLSTRGIKGTYFYFMDQNARENFKKMLEKT